MVNETIEEIYELANDTTYPIVCEKLGNGNIQNFKKVNDTYYDVKTTDEIINILEYARVNRVRLRMYFGDIVTGRDWDEIHDVYGYIGRSTGFIKIPLLVYNARSYGGGGLLSNCIVKIETSKGKKELYKHPTYHKESKQ